MAHHHPKPLLPALAPEPVPRIIADAERAPELRRQAARLDQLAAAHPEPDRVRRLARDCRLRAAELELGPQARETVAGYVDLVGMMCAPARFRA